MHIAKLLFSALSVSLTSASVLPPRDFNSSSATVRELLKAENGSWFENIAVRSNGKLLATRLDIPSVYQIDPVTGAYSVIANFTDVTAALGIVEYAPDVFAVTIGNFSRQTFTGVHGTYSVQSIDLNRGLGRDGRVVPKLLAKVPDATILNGLTFRAPNRLYSADSFVHQIWEIDTETGAVSVAVPPDALFADGPSTRIPAGINGLKWDEAGKRLFFTNSNRIIAGSVALGNATSKDVFQKPLQLATGIAGTVDYDDLAIDPFRGDMYIANGLGGIDFVSRDGRTQYLIQQRGSVSLHSPTATIFGRGRRANVLYITTSGLDANYNVAGGQVASYSFEN